MPTGPAEPDEPRPSRACLAVVIAAGLVGLGLTAHAGLVSSATYDEVAYLRIAGDWWLRGDSSEMTRMGSPVTFFKLQQAPTLLGLTLVGLGRVVADPMSHLPMLLPIARLGALWIWATAFAITVAWSRRVYGPRAMAMAACLFALSPNLVAHGSILTMEMPLIAASAATFWLFFAFLETGRRRCFVAGAVACGLAFSCKFTTVLIPPILASIWVVDRWRRGEGGLMTVAAGMAGYTAIVLVSDLALTGFAFLPPSGRSGYHPSAPASLGWLLETPMPQDWVGLANQFRHQRTGGPSYLFGERRMTGWWYYYPIALAVKVPLGCWLLLGARAFLGFPIQARRGKLRVPGVERSEPPAHRGHEPDTPGARSARPRAHGLQCGESGRADWFFPMAIGLFLAAAMAGSKRNYGVRYLLPMAPLAIVWVSALAERAGGWRWIVGIGLILQAAALASVHPHELGFFNRLAGGTIGGRHLLADSNLDWGQGLRSLARIEGRFAPLTLYYFGDVDPSRFGVRAESYLITAVSTPRPLPPTLTIATRYLAVSASLQHGPWGPEGYFRRLDGLKPVAFTDDGTIAIYDLAE